MPPLRFALSGREADLTAVTGACAAATSVATLCAAFSCYLRWRLTSEHRIAWLATALFAISMPHFYWFTLTAGVTTDESEQLIALAATQALTAVALGGILFVDRLPANPAPLAAGTVIGVVILAVRALVVTFEPSVHLGDVQTVPIAIIAAADVVILLTVVHLSPEQQWLRLRVLVALALMGAAQVAAQLAADVTWLLALTVVAATLGAAVLVCLAFALVRLCIQSEREATTLLHRQLEDVEAGLRTERTQLHEIRATLAGISAASHLLHEDSPIGPSRRRQLETMMDAELSRLERLLSRRSVAVSESVSIDELLEPLVLRHRARDCAVRWAPSGSFGFGRADELAEAVNILLENAYQHGAGGETWIQVHEVPDHVEIVVSDSGPGVDRSIRDHIFDWGIRRPGSSGEGIGLSAARRLATDMGGYLHLVDSPAPGATFVLGLPTFPACARDRAHSA